MEWCRQYKITIEPVYFLFMFSQGFYNIANQALYIDKVCRVNFNYTMEICNNLPNHTSKQIEVQKYVASLQAYNAILQSVPGIFYALFAGPWSDTNGRKALLIFSALGYFINNFVMVINAYFDHLKAEFLLFECLQDFTGGNTLFFLACSAYLTDVSTQEERTTRFAFLDGLWPFAYYLGNYLAGLVKSQFGFIGNFGLGTLVSGLNVLYISLVVKESRSIKDGIIMTGPRIESNNDQDEPRKKGLKALFNLSNVKDGFKILLKKRPNNGRMILILAMTMLQLNIFVSARRSSAMYLYFRKKFQIQMADYASFFSTFGFTGSILVFIGTPYLTQRFKDTTIICTKFFCSIIFDLMMAYVANMTQLYYGILIAGFSFGASSINKSLLSKLIDPLDVGKLFAINGAIQALVPFLSSPTFAFIYKTTVASMPHAFLLFSIGLWTIMSFMSMYIRK